MPSVTSSATAGQGLDWVAAFISACAGRVSYFGTNDFKNWTDQVAQCYFDYVNIHWYGTSFSDFQTHVQNAHNRFPSYQVRT
jgi:hypothetical protein